MGRLGGLCKVGKEAALGRLAAGAGRGGIVEAVLSMGADGMMVLVMLARGRVFRRAVQGR